MENKDWKDQAKSYSENWILGKKLRTYYNEKNEIVRCEDASTKREELLKGIKRLKNADLVEPKTKKQREKSNKAKKNRDEIKKFKKQLKKQNPRK